MLNSCKTLIGVHSTMHLTHPNYVLQLLLILYCWHCMVIISNIKPYIGSMSQLSWNLKMCTHITKTSQQAPCDRLQKMQQHWFMGNPYPVPKWTSIVALFVLSTLYLTLSLTFVWGKGGMSSSRVHGYWIVGSRGWIGRRGLHCCHVIWHVLGKNDRNFTPIVHFNAGKRYAIVVKRTSAFTHMTPYHLEGGRSPGLGIYSPSSRTSYPPPPPPNKIFKNSVAEVGLYYYASSGYIPSIPVPLGFY